MDGIGLVAAIGGALLAVALIFVVIGNSRRSKGEARRSDKAAKNLYDRVDREDQASDPDAH